MNRFDRDRFDQMGKEALSRVEELMNSSRINELLHKREEDEKKKNCILWVLAIIGAVAAVGGGVIAVNPSCIRCIPFLYSGLSGGF